MYILNSLSVRVGIAVERETEQVLNSMRKDGKYQESRFQSNCGRIAGTMPLPKVL